MKEELNLDQLLVADREHLRRATLDAIAHGLVQRVSAATLPKREPRLKHSLFAALAASAALVLLTIAVPHRTGELDVSFPVTARAIPVPTLTVNAPFQHPVAPIHHVAKKPRAREAAPFPTPTPLSAEERTLVLVAQSGPVERALVLAQQQQLSDDFVNGIEQFNERIQQQEGKPQ